MVWLGNLNQILVLSKQLCSSKERLSVLHSDFAPCNFTVVRRQKSRSPLICWAQIEERTDGARLNRSIVLSCESVFSRIEASCVFSIKYHDGIFAAKIMLREREVWTINM